MPPRHTYWTIILEGKPTAFRAHTREELLPTLRQLQGRHPDTVLLWFARGRLWQSPEEERAALAARRMAERERRGRDWRPGGSHRDPRDRFKVPRDEKRRRFRDRLYRERTDPAGDVQRPRTEPQRPRPDARGPRPERDRPRTPREGERPWKPARPRDDRFRSGEGEPRPGPPGRRPGWKPSRPAGQGQGSNRGWKPSRPPGQGQGDNRGWKSHRPPDRPRGQGNGGNRGGKRSGPPAGRRDGRKPGGGGRKGGGGGGSPR